MLHEPSEFKGEDHYASYKAKIGLYMFVLYGLIYAGFVIINIFNPLLMEKIIFMGLNLAVIYGFGLIILAMVFALIYNIICTRREKESF